MIAVRTTASPARIPLHLLRIGPPPLRTADGHERDQRRASRVELFFDLVFAGAVNQLAGTLQPEFRIIQGFWRYWTSKFAGQSWAA